MTQLHTAHYLPIMPGSDCTHTVFTDRAARWHAPVSHHWHRFAPAQRGAAGPRDTVLLLTAASSCMCAQAGHAGAAASRSTVSGQPGAHRTSTRPKHNHPAAVKSLLNKWFHANYDHPFPDGRTKAELAARTGERLLPSCGASW